MMLLRFPGPSWGGGRGGHATSLQECDSDEDPGHQGEVVLQPLLELRDAALHVDVVLLLRVLVNTTSSHQPHRFNSRCLNENALKNDP